MRMTLQNLQERLEGALGQPRKYINTGLTGRYKINQFHPEGVGEIWYTFGGISELIDKFILEMERYAPIRNLRHGIFDVYWFDHTLEQIKRLEQHEWNETTKRIIASEDHPNGYDVINAIILKGDNKTDFRRLSVSQLHSHCQLDDGVFIETMQSLERRNLITLFTGNPTDYCQLIPKFPRFCSWWLDESEGSIQVV